MTAEFKPRTYQQAIVGHIMSHERCNVWAGMGTGKTSSTLTALKGLTLVEDPFPVLVLAPLRVASSTWPDEARKWAHLRGLKVKDGSGSRIGPNFQPAGADIVTVNYDNVEALVNYFEGDDVKLPYRTVIADEATRLKSFRIKQGGRRAQALGKVAHTRVRRWVNLTGTPAPNGLSDLWGQQWFIDAGARLGRSFDAFERRWFAWKRSDPKDPWKKTKFLLDGAQEEIEQRLADCTITIRAGDYIDLPPLIENVIEVDLPAQARRHYRELEKELFTKLDTGEEVEAFNAAALTMKCLQAANGALYTDDQGNWKEIHDAKLDALASVVEEAAGAPVLCSYVFKSDVDRILKAFPFATKLDSENAIRAFSRGEIPLGVGHPASMGHGVDGLQNHCTTGVFFGSDWNLEHRLQMIERIGPTRQAQLGRAGGVTWHSIVARGTLDSKVIARHKTKASIQSLLMDALKYGA